MFGVLSRAGSQRGGTGRIDRAAAGWIKTFLPDLAFMSDCLESRVFVCLESCHSTWHWHKESLNHSQPVNGMMFYWPLLLFREPLFKKGVCLKSSPHPPTWFFLFDFFWRKKALSHDPPVNGMCRL